MKYIITWIVIKYNVIACPTPPSLGSCLVFHGYERIVERKGEFYYDRNQAYEAFKKDKSRNFIESIDSVRIDSIHLN